ncbi:winged helix DNA-binding domain-containing protein [Mucilaginibacter sp. OK098]|uniref:winged helix DNA-binding domain-containing protein n=1 Tax=Mucilaginibacter sp. OK098 TaxID=1855297 RepID=UPI000922F9AC|nr:winged helix DNA-binding domain-containing protein [Mucilaginibacter sp. OK098]SHM97386.1 Winged helix DNA-binding domain-containing protein [Mucilaginibacter sp. OK098]
MTDLEIAQQRLYTQHIAAQTFATPSEIVKYMGAMQAQDYAGAKWAVGMRLQKSNDAAVDKAMADGSIIRTHVLRPTWHFVAPDDLRWMLDLTAHRIISLSASRERQLKLDASIFKQSNDALGKALTGGKQLSRLEMMDVLQQAGVDTNEERFIHLLMRAELDRVICSGARLGKQFSYTLFDDRVPRGNTPSHEEALAELVKRYFISRGPATLQDFAWWSGLTLTDAKTGLDVIKSELTNIQVNGHTYWMPKDQPVINTKAPIAHLLPAYDEFAVAYSDRTAAVNPKYLVQARHVIFDPSIIINNQVVGTWKRAVKKNEIEIVLNPFGKLNKVQTKAIEMAQKRYQKFMKD